MSSKQLARSVIEGRQVTFDTETGTFRGYLCGMDDFHWMIVTSNGFQLLIHKSAPVVTMGKDCTYDSEEHKDVLEDVVAPFRRYVEETYFGKGKGAQGA